MSLPDDIEKAKQLFSNFEKLSPQLKVKKFSIFIDAIKVLNNYLKENPNSSHSERITNIKKSNTRSLLINLDKLHVDDYDDWFIMRLNMIMHLDNIISDVLKSNLELKDKYKVFTECYAKEFASKVPHIIKKLEKLL